MAEGRWLPWKEQKLDIRPTPDYKELAKPLRAPPHGLEWRRLGDGAWELRSIAISQPHASEQEEGEKSKDEEAEDAEKEHAPEFLEHVVMPDDTLTGICLKYKVKDRELRRLNGFVGDHFRMCDALIVPNRFAPGQQPIQGAVGKQPMTKEDMMQVFRRASRLGTEETKFYLESSGWDLSKALAEWRSEIRWEAEQMKSESSGPATRRGGRQRGTLRRRGVPDGDVAPSSGSVFPLPRLSSGYDGAHARPSAGGALTATPNLSVSVATPRPTTPREVHATSSWSQRRTAVVSGTTPTSREDAFAATDGGMLVGIEMNSKDELAEARVPLLAGSFTSGASTML